MRTTIKVLYTANLVKAIIPAFGKQKGYQEFMVILSYIKIKEWIVGCL